MQIGSRIRELRERRGLTQGDVERGTGMLRAYISRVEHGHTIPSVENIERFALVLGVPLHEMLKEEGGDVLADRFDEPFLRLLAGYVHKMAAADRESLLSLAQRLARDSGGGN